MKDSNRIRMMVLAVSLGLGMLAGGLLSAQKDPKESKAIAVSPDARFDHSVRQDFFAGFMGDREAFERAMKICEQTLAENPRHAEAMVWHGSGRLMQAGQAFSKGEMPRGFELWRIALDEMKRAVELAPDDVGVRVPRAATLLDSSRQVPPEWEKSLVETAVADYEHVHKLQAAYLDKISTHGRGELLFGLAYGWDRLGNKEKARHYYERVVRECEGSGQVDRAKQWLATGKLNLARDEMFCTGCHVK